MNKNSLLSMQDLSAEQILSILGDAKSFNSSHKDWQLPKHNALVANLFLRHRQELTSHLRVQSIS